MTIQYLVDTDWVISYLHGQAGVISRLDELKEERARRLGGLPRRALRGHLL